MQSRFRVNHSCTAASVNIVDDIICARDRKEASFFVLFDFTRAFDTVTKDLLVDILNYIELYDSSLKFFESSFSNRYHYVRLNNKLSTLIPCQIGTPQSSILRPILFSIYTSNVCFNINNIICMVITHKYTVIPKKIE